MKVEQITVLVVEDDELLVMVIAGLLIENGFGVVEAFTADAAVARLQDDTIGIDLVFSDVRMPGSIDGFGLADWMERHRPQIPIILASGYPDLPPGRAVPRYLMSKPYSLAEVLERIGAALGNSRPTMVK